MDAEWAALNVAQQAALIVWFPLGLYLAFKWANKVVARRWPLPLVLASILLITGGGTAMLIIVLGSVPK